MAARPSGPPDWRSITQTACVDDRAPVAEVAARRDHLTARRHDVFHHREAPAVDVAALGQSAGAVGLGLLAHEVRGDAGQLRQHRRDRHATELEPGERVGVGRHERHERGRDLAQQRRVGLEEVLVEVLVAHGARAQHELAGEVRAARSMASEPRSLRVVHCGQPFSLVSSTRRRASRRSTCCRAPVPTLARSARGPPGRRHRARGPARRSPLVRAAPARTRRRTRRSTPARPRANAACDARRPNVSASASAPADSAPTTCSQRS